MDIMLCLLAADQMSMQMWMQKRKRKSVD